MDHESIEKLIGEIEVLENSYPENLRKKLNFDLLKRIIVRLGSFSSDCQGCLKMKLLFEEHLSRIGQTPGDLSSVNLKLQKAYINQAIAHLQKAHKLVTSDYYTGLYMSLGISLGLVLGMAVFDNIALGLPIGIGVGIAIGAAMDADAKKNGRVI